MDMETTRLSNAAVTFPSDANEAAAAACAVPTWTVGRAACQRETALF